MKKIALLSLFIFLSLVHPTVPQTYVDLFSDYLPGKYLKDEDEVEQIEVNLIQYAKVNPDLIYYYLNYLNSIAEHKIFNRDSNYFNILQYETMISNRLNNEWVDEEMKKIQNFQEPDLILSELESMLDEFFEPEMNVQKFKVELVIDKNLQKYFSYKCLIKNPDIKYDEKLDYLGLVERTIEDLISRIILDYKNFMSDDNYIQQIKFEDLLQHHIFSKAFSDGLLRNLDFNFAKYLLTFIDYSDYRDYSGLIIGFNAQRMSYDFPGGTITESYLPFQEYSFNSTSAEINFYNLLVGYRIKFGEYKTAFSHLDMSLGWSFANNGTQSEINSININEGFFIWEGQPGNFTLLFYGFIDSMYWDLNNFSQLSANISLPTFYFTRKLYLEIGFQYQYTMAEYSITLVREIYDQTANDPSILGPELETFNEATENHLFGGSLIINYSIINNLNLKGTITTFPSVQFGLEYLFRL